MTEVAVNTNSQIAKESIRESIIGFENQLRNEENVFLGDSKICPLKHSFTDGMYVREIFIPAGTYIVGKIHKHEHPNFLLSGVVEVVTEEGVKTLVGPMSMISPAGTKRALHAITDVIWVTLHHNPTNTQDLNELESIVIAKDYEEYEKFVSSQKQIPLYKKILKLLNL